jgi:hypothetical protein
MQFRDVNALKIEEYIRGAWNEDEELEGYYDRSLTRRTLDGMVYDTSRKIRDMMEYDERLALLGIEMNREPIGFIILSDKLSNLYSFGVNVKYRSRFVLEHIFDYIKKRLKNNFYCVLYDYNTRAINWLINCGMEIDPTQKPSSDLVVLKFEICQQ